MAFNTNGSAAVPLSVYGGIVSEMAPTDLPEGVSPDCGDVVFAPGNVGSRPGFQKVLGSPRMGAIMGAKSFIDPDLLDSYAPITNLYLDATGSLWAENVVTGPGTLVLLQSGLAPNSYLKAVTADGREYLAISDGLHGSDVPLQWDGTYLDRVTQDGPAAPPTVTSTPLPSVAMLATGTGPTFLCYEIDPSTPAYIGTPSHQLNVYVNGPIAGVSAGNVATITGSEVAALNVTNVPVIAVYTGGTSPFESVIVLGGVNIPGGTTYGFNHTAVLAITGGVTMSRSGNNVTVTTNGAHGLTVGYQAQITGVPASEVSGISSIIVNNEDSPGIATVTCASVHDLVPGCQVSIVGVAGVAVGGGITAISWGGGVASVVTATPHNLSPGAEITIDSTTAFDVSTTVLAVLGPQIFTYAYTPVTAPVPESSGTVTLNWPIPTLPQPTYFEVLTAPTPYTFTVQLNYADSTFTTGIVNYAWDGIFYVKSVPNATTFTYQQYGPDATTASVGMVTPYGQAAPGLHQCQVLFLTRSGYVTRPSPPVNVELNGGQYVSVSNIPIGPPNVVARILAFTGAQGALFFYIPVPAQINGQIVSTATQIADNTSVSALLDFSDNSLFDSVGISIPGNTPANQIVLDGALGFGFYASRLITWGQRNIIQNLLSMSFDGGYLPPTSGAPTLPLGWNAGTNAGGALGVGWFGDGWQITLASAAVRGQLSQPMYEDAYGNPIATGNTKYSLRGWFALSTNDTDVVFHAKISSVSASFSTAVTLAIPADTTGSFIQATFPDVTPLTVPTDLTFTIWATATTSIGVLTVDDLTLIYAENPFSDTTLNISYTDNLEAFDGVSGVAGSTDDTQKIMGLAQIRDTAYMLTQDPGGRLHEFADNGVTEPSGWSFRQLATDCGLVSTFALTYSQADSGTASGGEQWFAWAGSNGAYIFGGGQVDKISQEIEPDWRGAAAAGASQWSAAPGLDPKYLTAAWALNDPAARVIYFGIPQVAS